MLVDKVIVDSLKVKAHSCVDDLKKFFSKYAEGFETHFGYICPGHGNKGKQEVLNIDEDSNTYRPGADLGLWKW